MRRVLLIIAAAASFAFAATSGASASVTWPASCTKMLCVNNHLNNLDTRMRAQGQRIVSLTGRASTLESQVAALQTKVSNLQAIDAEARLTSLETSRTNINSKLNCIGHRNVGESYGYIYDGSQGDYRWRSWLDFTASSYFDNSYTLTGATPFLVDSCGGIF